MARLLKDEYNPDFLDDVGRKIKTIFPNFNIKEFVEISNLDSWKEAGLKQRMRLGSEKLHDLLPLDYSQQMDILEKAGPHFRGLQGMLFPDFVEAFGSDHPERSLQALESLTEYSTGEFAIRPLILKHPDKAMGRMLDWTNSPNEHHRRLASEGCRPRLPWGIVLKDFVRNPEPVLNILDKLKKDNSKYVQKSVANNLNDVSKDHPETFVQLVETWGLDHPNTAWILKHASRTLLKKGQPKILAIFGYPQTNDLKIESVKLSEDAHKIGDIGHFSALIKNTGKKKLNYRAEYIVHYPRKHTGEYRKVFFIGENSILPGQEIELRGKLDFEEKSTRKVYSGKHGLSIQINGQVISHQSIHVR